MEKPTCKECAFFIQHYALLEHKLRRINCGHCTKVKSRKRQEKTREPGDRTCPEYVFAGDIESRFVSKEYLSKELLKRVLEMDLLPPMESWDGNE